MSLENVAWIEETNMTSITQRLLVEKQLTLSYFLK